MRLLLATLLPLILSIDMATAVAAPDLNGGVWVAVKPPGALRTTRGERPPLLPAAATAYEQHLADRRRGNLDFDTTERCLPPGLPRILMQPQPFEFLQRPEQVVIMYQWNRLVRIVDMSPAILDPIGPSHLGTSVGHWEGGTLVIESVDFVDSSLLDDAGLPHGEKLRVIERYTPSRDGHSMALKLSIEDPDFYAHAWDASLRFRHDARGEITEDVCVERKKVVLWKEP
jgi:hypothetical protein